MQKRRPVMLAILDGWGWREDSADNAVRQAKTPKKCSYGQVGYAVWNYNTFQGITFIEHIGINAYDTVANDHTR